MSDNNLGSRGSRGNIMRAFSRVIDLLEEIVVLLRQLNGNKQFNNSDVVIEKDRYNNGTGRKKGSI